MALTVRQFIYQAYHLINPSNPTQPLHGNDQSLMLMVLNQLLQSYASTGLLITIADTVSVPVNIGIKSIAFTPQGYVITPPDPTLAQISNGRLSNLDSAWLVLSGVTYPLIMKSRDEFLAAWKYEPLQGLPRFLITYPQVDYVIGQLYPAPSQFFDFFGRGKFQLAELTSNDTMGLVPQYYHRYLMFATAKDTAMYKGRADAWTEKLEAMYQEARDIMIASSEINLSIAGDEQSLLNGAWRVRAGI